MIKQIKDTARAGVTLVELLVVILIVAILAVSLLPMFQKYVIKAQYASEAIPLVGHLRTQIGLYYYEHGRLPVNRKATDWLIQVVKDTSNGYKLENKGTASYLGLEDADDKAATAINNFLSDIDVQVAELQGRRVRPENVEFALIANGNSYGYALGVFGNGTSEGLPGNSGYAILEMNFAGVAVGSTTAATANTTTLSGENAKGYKLVAEWSNYAQGTSRVNFTNTGSTDLKVAIPTASAAFGYANGVAATEKTKIPSAVLALLVTDKSTMGKVTGSNKYGKWTFPAVSDDFIQ